MDTPQSHDPDQPPSHNTAKALSQLGEMIKLHSSELDILGEELSSRAERTHEIHHVVGLFMEATKEALSDIDARLLALEAKSS